VLRARARRRVQLISRAAHLGLAGAIASIALQPPPVPLIRLDTSQLALLRELTMLHVSVLSW